MKKFGVFKEYKKNEDNMHNISFLIDDNGNDWYECQNQFKEDTLKICYTANGSISAFSKDASSLFPLDMCVLEIEMIANFNANDWLVIDGELIPMKPSEYHVWNGKKWELTKENKVKMLEDEKQSKIAENRKLFDETLQKTQDEIKYLERKKSRNKATENDLALLERLYDLEDDLRDLAKLGIDENSEIPNLPSEVQA